MKWKPPANPIHAMKGRKSRILIRWKQRPQIVVSSSLPPVAPTVTIPFEFGLGWNHEAEGVYEDPLTVKHSHDDDDELALGVGIDDDVDLRKRQFTDKQGKNVKFPEAYDQGGLGSCTANALAFCYQFDMLNEVISFGPGKTSIPSRLFIYYYERAIEGSISNNNKHTGAKLSDGINNVLYTKGVCSEDDWRYYDDDDTYQIEPDLNAINNAKFHKIISQTDPFIALYPSVENLKINLRKGFPIAFGFKVFQSFMYKLPYKDQIPAVFTTMPIPVYGEKIMGGHAVVLVGFKDKEKVFIVRNSWGKYWGENGYFYMPYEIIEGNYIDPNVDPNDDKKFKRYTSDFWSITEVS
uniref:Peptidase C1A papain C-terminal domain-containing protein n=1 Tax=viral metagenome TaxID=1070528 RepID=A0A6C0F202_9ZZZZ